MAIILYAGAIGLMIGLRGGLISILCGSWAIVIVAIAAFLTAPLDGLLLALQTGMALVSFNAFLMLSLYGRYRLVDLPARTA